MFSTVSIMPGIDAREPERTETSSGLCASPKRAAGDRLDLLQGRIDLRVELGRIGFRVGVKIGANVGRDGEARRHRQAEIGHFRQIGALAAQQSAASGCCLRRCRRRTYRPISSSGPRIGSPAVAAARTIHKAAQAPAERAFVWLTRLARGAAAERQCSRRAFIRRPSVIQLPPQNKQIKPEKHTEDNQTVGRPADQDDEADQAT